MKVEIDSENLLTLQILAAVLQTDVATVTNERQHKLCFRRQEDCGPNART